MNFSLEISLKSSFELMRIISGNFRGRQLHPPKGLPVRPTTDRTREALFNILNNYFSISELKVLDLFSGTGVVSLEFLSRGAEKVISVDKYRGCIHFLRKTVKAWNITKNSESYISDALKFLKGTDEQFDLIFMDPPYDLPRQEDLINTIFDRSILNKGGLLILEHRTNKIFDSLPGYDFTRTYGDSSLSFFFSDLNES